MFHLVGPFLNKYSYIQIYSDVNIAPFWTGVNRLILKIAEIGKKALDKNLSLVLCLFCNNNAVLA